jgi:cell division septation protein DedD
MPRLTTRDYKRPSRGGGGGRLKEFSLGVLVGVVLTSAAFLILSAHARHGAAAGTRGQATGGSTGAPHAPAPDSAPNAASTGGAADAGATPQAAAAPAQQYDFYRMLPRFKVPVPHDDDRSVHVPPPAPAGQTPRPAISAPSYIVQVGSYRSSAEAEQVRARLARVGLSAQVQRVVEGSITWNRVRIGPLTDTELSRVRGQLRTANINALVIRADR